MFYHASDPNPAPTVPGSVVNTLTTPSSAQSFRTETSTDLIKQPTSICYSIGECASGGFWTSASANRKRYLCKLKGFPLDLTGWMFITFDVDPKKYDSQREAYLALIEKLRRFWHHLRKLGYNWQRYCWKLEFNHNGYPHIHALVELPTAIRKGQFETAWRIGNVHIKPVGNGTSTAMFNYMTKPIGAPPTWVRDHKSSMRFWQTSRGFYGPKMTPTKTKLLSRRRKKMRKIKTLGESYERAIRTGTVRTHIDGKTVRSREIILPTSWHEFYASVSRSPHQGLSVVPNRRSGTGRIETQELDQMLSLLEEHGLRVRDFQVFSLLF